MNTLVLSGGANKGCYEAGAVEVILKSGFVRVGIDGISKRPMLGVSSVSLLQRLFVTNENETNVP